jgi:hypothetical protein
VGFFIGKGGFFMFFDVFQGQLGTNKTPQNRFPNKKKKSVAVDRVAVAGVAVAGVAVAV